MGEKIEEIKRQAEQDLTREEERLPGYLNNRILNLKKIGVKGLIPFLSKSTRMQNYFIDRVRKQFHGVLEKKAQEDNWSEDYLRNRFIACNTFSDTIKDILPNLNTNTKKSLLTNIFLHQGLEREPIAKRYESKYGDQPPSFLLISPSMKCNLKCNGCWASEYDNSESLSGEKVNDIINEAKNEMGIHFIVLTGGEPTMWPPLWDIVKEHDDVFFMPYTNGTKINSKTAKMIGELGNFYPCISVEGGKEDTDTRRGKGLSNKILSAMNELKDNGAFFGFSATHVKSNHNSLVNEKFFDEMIERGASLGWIFQYVPLGRDPNPDLAPTAEQRFERYEVINKLRDDKKPLLVYDFFNDGWITNGCIGWGKMYVHINHKGIVEPCAFIHYGKDNLHDVSLVEAVSAPWLKEARAMQPFHDEKLRPCPNIDGPHNLKYITEKHNIYGTHPGAELSREGPVYDKVTKKAVSFRNLLHAKEKKGHSIERFSK